MQINHLIIQECAKQETKCGFETTKKKNYKITDAKQFKKVYIFEEPNNIT